MTIYQDKAIAMLLEQQGRHKQYSPQWAVAEQIMDICRAEPESAELIAQDLENDAMSIGEAEKLIRKYASGNRDGACGFCPPQEADRILREFYGLRPAALMQQKTENAAKMQQTNFLDFDDLI